MPNQGIAPSRSDMRPIVTALLMVAGQMIAGLSGGAQEPRPCPAPTSEPYLLCQTDPVPRPRPDNTTPRYPVTALEAAASGVVRAAFVVTAAGRVDPASFALVQPANAFF